MSSDIAIKVENLSKCYQIYDTPRDRLKQFILPHMHHLTGQTPRQYFREFWALKDISFEVKKGETVGILGRNGSGKSTLLQIIAGTLSFTTGKIQTNGILAALLELGSGFNPEFTGRENIYLNGAILDFSREKIDEMFNEIVDFADIGNHLDQPVKTYSSGMSVRLAFAVQACVSPQILIIDEALSVGDEKFQRKCFDYIERLRTKGCSILLVTHSTATVEKFCQRGVLLHRGEMHGIGPAKEIVDLYHALLYSDEKVYLKYQNTAAASIRITPINSLSPASNDTDESGQALINQLDTFSNHATIRRWEILDKAGMPCEQFHSGERAKVSFYVDVLTPIEEVQAGILIRTVEGVNVFGTSTLYYNKNITSVFAGDSLRFDFDIELNLCEGSYFITLSIAKAISYGDMSYLDRKTDVIIIKVYQHRILASGIAMLDTTVDATKKKLGHEKINPDCY